MQSLRMEKVLQLENYKENITYLIVGRANSITSHQPYFDCQKLNCFCFRTVCITKEDEQHTGKSRTNVQRNHRNGFWLFQGKKQTLQYQQVAIQSPLVWKRAVTIPSWRISILIEQDHISRNPSKIGFHQGIQKFPSINWLHCIAESCIAWAEGHLHVVESIGHRIDCIDHKSHFGVLNMMCSQRQRACWKTDKELTFKIKYIYKYRL